MTMENRLERIRKEYVKSLPTTPNYRIELRPVGDNDRIYKIEKYDPITGWKAELNADDNNFVIYDDSQGGEGLYIDQLVNTLLTFGEFKSNKKNNHVGGQND